MGVSAKLQQSAASSSKQAGSRWKVHRLTRAGEEEDYRVHPTYLSLSFWITCNLKKNPLILLHTIKLCFFYQRGEVQLFSCACRKSCVDRSVLTFSICPDWKVSERPQTCSEQWGSKWVDLSHPAEATRAMEGKVTVKREHSVIIQINVTGGICRRQNKREQQPPRTPQAGGRLRNLFELL